MTTKRILIALAILLLAALAYWALDTYVTLTREPIGPPGWDEGGDVQAPGVLAPGQNEDNILPPGVLPPGIGTAAPGLSQ